MQHNVFAPYGLHLQAYPDQCDVIPPHGLHVPDLSLRHVACIYRYIGSGTILFSASKDKTIMEWDTMTSTHRKTLEGGMLQW